MGVKPAVKIAKIAKIANGFVICPVGEPRIVRHAPDAIRAKPETPTAGKRHAANERRALFRPELGEIGAERLAKFALLLPPQSTV
jgi:hypothetical protein